MRLMNAVQIEMMMNFFFSYVFQLNSIAHLLWKAWLCFVGKSNELPVIQCEEKNFIVKIVWKIPHFADGERNKMVKNYDGNFPENFLVKKFFFKFQLIFFFI